MGKVVLIVGLAILVLGVGPLCVVDLLSGTGRCSETSSLGLLALAALSVWPGIFTTTLGVLMCLSSVVRDRLC